MILKIHHLFSLFIFELSFLFFRHFVFVRIPARLFYRLPVRVLFVPWCWIHTVDVKDQVRVFSEHCESLRILDLFWVVWHPDEIVESFLEFVGSESLLVPRGNLLIRGLKSVVVKRKFAHFFYFLEAEELSRF